jgi:hypothetical protein
VVIYVRTSATLRLQRRGGFLDKIASHNTMR